jgi:hypothetical protein
MGNRRRVTEAIDGEWKKDPHNEQVKIVIGRAGRTLPDPSSSSAG